MPWHGDGDGWTVVSRKSKGQGKSGVWLDFLLEIPFVIFSQWVRLGCGPCPCLFCRDPGDCLACLVCAVTIPATVFPSCLCGLAAYKNTMADAEMEAELQGLQAGEERRGSDASQADECCLETMVEQIFAVGTDQARSKFDAICQIFFKKYETFALPCKCQEEKKEEETVKMNKSEVEPVSKWRCPRQAGSFKVHRVVWSLIFHLFGEHLVKAEVQEDQARDVHQIARTAFQG